MSKALPVIPSFRTYGWNRKRWLAHPPNSASGRPYRCKDTASSLCKCAQVPTVPSHRFPGVTEFSQFKSVGGILSSTATVRIQCVAPSAVLSGPGQ